MINIKRKWFTNNSTVGEMFLDHTFECFTLEDTVRENQEKVPNKTAIPKGRYEVIINFSKRFGRPMPLLLSVPGFEGVRIHSGNTAEDTEGCILLGRVYNDTLPNFIGESRIAFNSFYSKLEDALKTSKVYLSIA